MKKILALDISSSTVGWSCFEYDQTYASLKAYGHYKPPTKKQAKDSTPVRLIKAINQLENLIDRYKPDEIVIEDYAKRFSKGKSTAETIILLSIFNEVLGMISYQKLGKDPFRYPVATIRSQVGKHFGIKVVSKDDIFPVIIKNCPSFSPGQNKRGNIPKEAGDRADAIALAITHILKQSNGALIWKL